MEQEYHLLDSFLYWVNFCYGSLGNEFNNGGEMESQDSFLRHMSGIMRLYGEILISQPCRYQDNKSHPHGL
jgi:hypothetical protein